MIVNYGQYRFNGRDKKYTIAIIGSYVRARLNDFPPSPPLFPLPLHRLASLRIYEERFVPLYMQTTLTQFRQMVAETDMNHRIFH